MRKYEFLHLPHFPKLTSPTARLEFELAYYDIVAQLVIYYITLKPSTENWGTK